MKYSFLQSEYRNSSPGASRYHVIPVPLESTVSYGSGTMMGPEAVLEASFQLERIIEGLGEPGLYGIHTAHPVDCTFKESQLEVFLRIADVLDQSVSLGSVPIVLGGEHSVTNGAIEFLHRKYPRGSAGIIQFDAHMDLRDSYEGSPWSHAAVMRRAVEKGIPLFQVGIRNYCEEEIEARRKYDVGFCDASQVHRLMHSPGGLGEIRLPESFPKTMYITFDVDCFDASLMPATGTPEPGGLFWWEAIELLKQLSRRRKIIGADVVELSPVKGLHHCSYTAAKLAYTIMGLASPALSHTSHL